MTVALSALQERLSAPPPTVATEFFTHAEMAEAERFKKVTKKKRKLRKKVTVTADDLIGLEADRDADLGSRYLCVVWLWLTNALLFIISRVLHCLQCFDAVGWPAGRASGL